MQLKDTTNWFRGPRYAVPVRNNRRRRGHGVGVSWVIGLTIGVATAIAVAWSDGIGQALEPTALKIEWRAFGWAE